MYQAQFSRQYRKAYMKLLSAVVSVPKSVDEYFFCEVDDRDEETSEVRPYFYAAIAFGGFILIVTNLISK